MPFIRQTRDKRGFEQTLVMHTYHPGANGPHRPRVLYLFRSPANLRVGRQALDAEVMEALEHTHPDLSFDWGSISRETPRIEPPNDRQARRTQRPPERPASRPAPEPPALQPPLPDDPSILGRVLGAAEAARLRGRYAELVQRIGRRARSPEERDRLFERIRRLNPDDWPDEMVIRAETSGVDAAWNALAAELPSRRRGRRGGRRRPEGAAAPSGIMVPSEEVSENDEETPERTPGVRSAGTADSGGDGGAVGSESAPTTASEGPDPGLPHGD